MVSVTSIYGYQSSNKALILSVYRNPQSHKERVCPAFIRGPEHVLLGFAGPDDR